MLNFIFTLCLDNGTVEYDKRRHTLDEPLRSQSMNELLDT